MEVCTKKSVLVLALALGAGALHAGVMATEYTQMMNNVQLVQQVSQMSQALQVAMQSYNDAIKQGMSLPNQVFSSVQSDLNELASVVRTGQSIANTFGSLDSDFSARFPGYKPSGGSFRAKYKDLAQSTLDTIRGTLKAAGLTQQQMQTEQATLDALKQMSQSANGRNQVIEVGNQVAVEEVAQLQKLRQLILADMQSKAAFQAAQMQKQATEQADLDDYMAPAAVDMTGAKSY